jgi:hypothetical protein
MSQLKPGMTEPQALAALGLTGYARPMVADGPINGIRMVYPLRRGMNLCLVFDCTLKPKQLREGEIAGTDDEDRGIAAIFTLLISGSWLFTRRQAKVVSEATLPKV